MKKISVILLLSCLIFIVLGHAFTFNKNTNSEPAAEMFIGGRLPVEKNDINVEDSNSKKVISNIDINSQITENPDTENNSVESNIQIQIRDKRTEPTDKTELSERLTLFEQIKEHTVKHGESLWTISHIYNIDIDTIIGANDISNMNMIQEGDKLKILPVKGIMYRVNPGESLWIIASNFNISVNDIVEANNINNPEYVKPGKLLILPGAKPEFGYKERMSSKLMKPVNARISSYYGMRWGRMHEGVDFAINTGTKIKAAAAGKIIYSGWASGYGYTVIIEHQKGVRTLYAHNSKLLVHSGQYVSKGQYICLSGNTGNSTGPHLHFEVQINGRPVNPLSYIK